MFPVLLPISQVEVGQVFAFDDQQIFGVFLLGSFRKVVASGNKNFLINDHNLVMGDGMGRVNIGGNAGIGQKRGRGIFLFALALVQNGFHLDAPLVGCYQGLGDGLRGKAVGLDHDF